jgi:hypothetical protein
MVAQTQKPIKMITYYIIPNNVNYVQSIKEIETWTKTDKVDFSTPIVAVIDDSKVTKYTRFVVIYKGMMQTQGGTGSCYNPCKPTFLHKEDPMNNSIMPAHMSKWVLYDYAQLLKLVISTKCQLLEQMGIYLPYAWGLENYDYLQGILIAKLDAIGMGRADCSILSKNHKKQLKVLIM